MKKVMSRVLAVVICLAMVMESQAVSVLADETKLYDEILPETSHEEEYDISNIPSTLDLIDDENSKVDALSYSVNLDDIRKEETLPIADTNISVESPDNAIEVSGTDSLGAMLSSVINDKADEQDKNNGCTIFSVEMSGNMATVEYETIKKAELVVAIYEEDGVKQLASGKTEVTDDTTTAIVSIDIDVMPQYYFLRAYLIMPDTLQPLCTSYETPNYTKDMQEFFAKTTDDFVQDRVLNLDDDKTDNFLVYSENVTRVHEETDVNTIAESNTNEQIYVFENPDDRIKSLKIGDIISYEYSDGMLIIFQVEKIEISEDGTSVTLTGKNSSLESVFEYVRIDTESRTDDAIVDTSNLEDEVTYVGKLNDGEFDILENNTSIQNHYTYDEAITADKLDADAEISTTYKLKYKALTGSLGLKFKAGFKCYISLFHQYIEYRVDSTLKASIEIEGKLEKKIPLGTLVMQPVPGITITFTDYFVVKASGKLKGEYTISGTIGKVYDSDSGFKNLNSAPKEKGKIKGEITIFIGLSLECTASALSAKFINIKVSAEIGAELKGELASDVPSTSKIHLCDSCVDGDVYGKFEVSFGIDLLGNELIGQSIDNKITFNIKIADWYYSLDHNEWGFGECPHIAHKVALKVCNKDDIGLQGAVISTSDNDFIILVNKQPVKISSLVTNEKGKVTYYQESGEHRVSIKTDEYIDMEKTYEVRNTKLTLLYKLKEKNSDTPGEDDEDEDSIYVNKISIGGMSSGAIKNDGSLWMWGENENGQLGNGNKDNILSPFKLLDDVKSINTTGTYSAAVMNNGSLMMWGNNIGGQLGDGTTTERLTPYKLMDDVKQVSLGGDFAAAIKKDKSLWLWGFNANGFLGNLNSETIRTPFKFMDDIEYVSCGGGHSGVIKEDGSLWVWGINDYGQLGDSTLIGKNTPFELLDEIEFISFAYNTSAAIKKDGSLWVWGDNTYGGLGLDEREHILSPRKLMDSVKFVCMGYDCGAAIKEDGSLWMWGTNSWGRFGNGLSIDDLEEIKKPVKVMDNVKYISLASHNAAIKEDGSLWMWGTNLQGCTGSNSTDIVVEPFKLMDLGSQSINNSLSNNQSDDTTYLDDISPLTDKSLLWAEQTYENDVTSTSTTSFTELDSNSIYNFYIISDKNSENKLDSTNLLYIAQGRTDNEGRVSFTYSYDRDVLNPDSFIVKQWDSKDENKKDDEKDEEEDEEDESHEGFWIDSIKNPDFNGKAQTQNIRVFFNESLLNEKQDYTISYKNNTNAYNLSEGDVGFNAKKAPSITITGKGNYNGKDVIYFKILPLDISKNDFSSDDMTLSYTKKVQKLSPTLYWKGTALKIGKDYSISIYKSDDVGRTNPLGNTVKDIGDYVIRFTGINNFTGTREVNLKVSAEYTPVSKLSVGKIKDTKYTGNEITPEPLIKYGKKLLVKDTHYTLSYKTNTEVGTGFVFITGKPENGYSGTRRVAFKITGTPIKNAVISGLPKAASYIGNEIKYETDVLKLYIKASKITPQIDLVRDKDYSVSYSNNVNAGKATITIKGEGGYTGTVKKTLKINPFDISSNMDKEGRFVINCATTAVYSKGGAKPEISASFKNADGSVQELVAGIDYTVSYKNNTSVGGTKKPMAIVSGKGNFKGKRNCEFTITAKDISSVTLNAADTVFKNKANTYSTKVSLVDTDGKALKLGTDYEKKLKYTYLNDTEVQVNGTTESRVAGTEVGTKDIIPAGTTIKVTATAKGNYTETVSGTYRITKASITSAKVSGIATQIYSGKPITFDPSTFTVKVGKTKLVPFNEVTGEGDFIIKGYSNNTKKGTATVTLQGVGNYGGTKAVKFKINAKGFKWWWRK